MIMAGTSVWSARAARDLQAMQRSLRSWLRYRRINDRCATCLSSPEFMAQRAADEQRLATQLYPLLAEVFDASSLPSPDIRKEPDAAVQMAELAITGKPSPVAQAPEAQGLIWLWPVAIVAGAAALVITSAIRNQAELAAERERLECIKAGACTDTGLWLKWGAILVGGWIAWDKLGVGDKVKAAMRRSA
jgi:hypothetical protein